MLQYHPSSYKDRSGFIFTYNDVLYRQINQNYKEHFSLLQQTGLYTALTSAGKLIKHTLVDHNYTQDANWYITLEPERIHFISYAYEWSFLQLKDAALLTLAILEEAIEHGMLLKDATPYNIQFVHGKPIFIDTLSFEKYDEKKPWVAYYQFCETFLYPLLIAHYGVQEVHKTFTVYPDGIASNHAVKLLPRKAKYNLFNYLHVYLVNKFKQKKQQDKASTPVQYSKVKMLNMITHLKDRIQQLTTGNITTEWNTYYNKTILSDVYLQNKTSILKNWLGEIHKQTIWDMGCNDGYFSNLFATNNNFVYATDYDSACVQNLYQQVKELDVKNIQPLCIDIMQPSTNQGFFNKERLGVFSRIKVDTVLMLALIHHLVFSKNLTLALIAKNTATIAENLIIEFVPKDDEKVQQLLKTKEDVFIDYDRAQFEEIFTQYYTIDKKETIATTNRILYFMKRL
jgi:ribosomal protein L11 methylase PrmA